jgi:hypothetical protein
MLSVSDTRVRTVIGVMIAATYAVVAAQSYSAPIYRFAVSGAVVALSVTSIVAIALWHNRPVRRLEWLIPVAAVTLTLISFPGTSRDYLRYLFDGELIRVWHLSPYAHLPGQFRLDQYTQAIGHIWWTQIPSPYGPLWQTVMVGVNLVSNNSLFVGVVVLKVLGLIGVVFCARYLYLLTGKASLSFLFLINPVILLDTVGTPHTDIFIMAALLAACYHRSTLGRGILLAAAGAIKIPSLIFVPFIRGTRRAFWWTALSTVLAFTLLLTALRPVVHFKLIQMLAASEGGGVTGTQSLLMHSAMPGASVKAVFIASYAMFFLAYGLIALAFVRRRITEYDALALTGLLVPLCLTGLLLPWHFMVPLALLMLNERRVARWVMMFITLLVLRSATTVLELLVMAGLFGLGGWIIWWANARLTKPPRFMGALIKLFG